MPCGCLSYEELLGSESARVIEGSDVEHAADVEKDLRGVVDKLAVLELGRVLSIVEHRPRDDVKLRDDLKVLRAYLRVLQQRIHSLLDPNHHVRHLILSIRSALLGRSCRGRRRRCYRRRF
jgi:hypothetical protein